jgi:hypothetical protein
MSNYLFAMGKEHDISIIHLKVSELISNSEAEISISQLSNDYWILIIERRSEHVNSSIQTDTSGEGQSGFFFKGWFQDHASESIVIGPLGCGIWKDSNEESNSLEFEGTYVHAKWNDQNLK